MTEIQSQSGGPEIFSQASIAVDLGAESCRVSLLRWVGGEPRINVVHRFANGPLRERDGTLRWPIDAIVSGVEHGIRLCADIATEGIQSIGVDGWAVDYVRLDDSGEPLELPFCYRDERNEAAQNTLHERISPERLREITGLQLQPLNTLYQLFADRLASKPSGVCWLNLPEYFLARWSGERVSEYTNATHTEMVDLQSRGWSGEILQSCDISPQTMPKIVSPGTVLGSLKGPLSKLSALRNTLIIAPACHDTASAVAGIPARGDDWGYISCGTWSLVGTPVKAAWNDQTARAGNFTNIGLDGTRLLLQKNMNGMWLLKQCMDAWSAQDSPWDISALCIAASEVPEPELLLNVDDPDLLRMGAMPSLINAQLSARGGSVLDESAANAPAMASLIFHSLAAGYAEVFRQIEVLTGKSINRIFFIGGGSRNEFLRRLTARATGKEVRAGSPESSTIGNFALQLAACKVTDEAQEKSELIERYATMLCAAEVTLSAYKL